MYKESAKIIGYHGTPSENVPGIINNNFKESENHDIWLGNGVYFFVDGIGIESPTEYARKFAIDSCWNNIDKKYTKKEVSVVEASIKINNDKFLDLTEEKGNQLFNEFRDRTIAKIESSGKSNVEPMYLKL